METSKLPAILFIYAGPQTLSFFSWTGIDFEYAIVDKKIVQQ